MKIDISKGWIAYLSFVWGLWIATFCLVLDEMIVWNLGYTFFFSLHIMANILTLWICRVRKGVSEAYNIEKGNAGLMTKDLDIDKKFKEFMVIDRVHPNFIQFGHQWIFRYPNGYGASLVSGGPMCYGEYEMAVLKYIGKEDTEYNLTYDTPITEDVLGYLTLKEVEKHLEEISKLPQIKEKKE